MRQRFEFDKNGDLRRKKLSLPAKIRIGYNILLVLLLIWIIIALCTRPQVRYWQHKMWEDSWHLTQEIFKF